MNIILKIGKVVSDIEWIKPFVRRFLNPIRQYYWEELIRKKSEPFCKYGIDTIRIFHEVAEREHINYTLAFGSVLGAVREHGFIKHDLDIDVFVRIEDYNDNFINALLNRGFNWYCKYTIQDDMLGREDTFEYKGCHIDIFYLYEIDERFAYCCDFIKSPQFPQKMLPRKLILPIAGLKRRLELFEGMQLYVPRNAEEFCEYRYGEDYMIPNPEWTCRKSINCIIEWPEVIDKVKIVSKPKLN